MELIFFQCLVAFGLFQSAFSTTASYTLLQCYSSSDRSGWIYTPNIPDFYFHPNATYPNNINMLRLWQSDYTYHFTIPHQRNANCSGTVRALQYCYYNITNTSRFAQFQIGQSRAVFDYMLTRRDSSVRNKSTVSSSSNSSCTRVANSYNGPREEERTISLMYCCDITELPSHFQISVPSPHIFSVRVNRSSRVQLARFRDRLSPTDEANRSPLLLRFLIGMMKACTSL